METVAMTDKAVVIQQADQVVAVKTASDRQTAADLWDAIRAFRKEEERLKEDHCRPLKTAWDEAKAGHDAFIKECQGYETRLQGLMSAFDREQDRLARVEQERLQAIVDKANAKIEAKAEAKGIEPVLKVAPVVQAAPKSIETQAGTTQGRSEKKVYTIKGEIAKADVMAGDLIVAQLVKDYPSLFVLDRVRFNRLASTGMLDNHPNVKVDIEYVYSQRR